MLAPFRLARPRTLPEALDTLSEDHVAYCGGTELLLAMRVGITRPGMLVDVKALSELAGIKVDGDQLVIGARESHMDVGAHSLVHERVPMLAAVENAVGNARVRAQGSVGGNLCFAEPKSDLATALIALDASVVLEGQAGRRELTVENFILGPYYADKQPGELLVDIRIPLPSPGFNATYVKYQTMERPTVGVALAHDVERGQSRLVVGAVGEVPVVWTFASPSDIDPETVAAEVDPTPDLTGSERYKRHVTGVYVRRAVRSLGRVGN